jgi:uncharacterized protein (TIGR00730 family)
MRRICVFASASPGLRPQYAQAATELAEALARRTIGLVYGGARVGLMGVLANAMLKRGGEVIGVIPDALVSKEVAHQGLTELRIVGSMHERKQQMTDLADAFIALPGGLGTLEELAEILTWAQLGLHAKPIGILNIEGFFDHLAAYLDHTVAERFVLHAHREMLLVADAPDLLLNQFESYQPPAQPKWIDRTES